VTKKKTTGEKDWENRMSTVKVKENCRRRYKQVMRTLRRVRIREGLDVVKENINGGGRVN